MVTHSSSLAWRIPWTRSLAGYSPRGPKKSDMTNTFTFSFFTMDLRQIWKETFFLCYFAFLCLPSIHISWLFLLSQLIKGLFLQLDFFIYHAV